MRDLTKSVGRPRMGPGRRRTKTIPVRVSPVEYDRIARRAAQAGMTVSAWLRWRGEAGTPVT